MKMERGHSSLMSMLHLGKNEAFIILYRHLPFNHPVSSACTPLAGSSVIQGYLRGH